MEKQLFANEATEERRRYLEDSAYKVAKEGYFQQLSPEERIESQEQLTKLQSDILQTEQEKAEMNKELGERLKKLKTRNRFLVHELKTNTREVLEDVFYLADDESRMMGIYNAKGELIRQRPMTADELQKSIFQLKKAQ